LIVLTRLVACFTMTLMSLELPGRLVWILLVLVNLRPHYFSCTPGFGA
jgi:hypothetical protein